MTTHGVESVLGVSTFTIHFNSEIYLIDCSSESIVVTFPSIASNGHYFKIKRVDNSINTLTLTGNTISETIDGNISIPLLENDKLTFVSYNGTWVTI